jgi:AraC-like DNA-binding protein
MISTTQPYFDQLPPEDINVSAVGLFNTADVAVMERPHRHRNLELNLITAGSASYILNGRRYELRRNTLVWLFSGQVHLLLEKSRRLDYWLGLFPAELLKLICTGNARTLLATDPTGIYCRDLSDKAASRIITIFEQVNDSRHDETKNVGLGYAVLCAWDEFAATDEHMPPTVHPAVESAMRLIHADDESMGLEFLASQVGLTPQYLSELFKSQTGTTISRYRNKVRIQRYLELSADSSRDWSIVDLALEAGFGSYPQFHRVFVEHMNCTPSEYRDNRIRRRSRTG